MSGNISQSYGGPKDPAPVVTLPDAIRRFTVEAPGDRPNGPHEVAIAALGDALDRGDIEAARSAYRTMCRSLSRAVGQLRRSAEAHFGGNFRKAPESAP